MHGFLDPSRPRAAAIPPISALAAICVSGGLDTPAQSALSTPYWGPLQTRYSQAGSPGFRDWVWRDRFVCCCCISAQVSQSFQHLAYPLIPRQKTCVDWISNHPLYELASRGSADCSNLAISRVISQAGEISILPQYFHVVLSSSLYGSLVATRRLRHSPWCLSLRLASRQWRQFAVLLAGSILPSPTPAQATSLC